MITDDFPRREASREDAGVAGYAERRRCLGKRDINGHYRYHHLHRAAISSLSIETYGSRLVADFILDEKR